MGLTYKNVKAEQFSNKYGLWSDTTVKRILANETYIGKLIQGTCMKASYKDKKVVPVPKEHWYIVENHHPPIIDQETFNKVEKLRERRRICADNQGPEKKIHIFAGKLRCATCGHTMIKSGGVKGKKDWYLRCQLSNKSRQKECTSHSICYSVIENLVWKRINEVVNMVIKQDGSLSKLEGMFRNEGFEAEIIKNKSYLKKISIDIEENTKAVQFLYSDRVNNQITEEMFFNLKEGFEEKLHLLKEKKKQTELETEKLIQQSNSKRDIRKLVRTHMDYSELTHEIVNDFIDYIEIGEKNKETEEQDIIIHWNF